MDDRSIFNGQWRKIFGILVTGVVLMISACGQEGGQAGDLSKKPPPSLGAISSVDGSDEGKKEEKKPQAGTEQTPAQSPTGSQPAQTAPKQ